MMMRVLTSRGLVEVLLLDEEDRSIVGSYWNAVRQYANTGRTGRLAEFEDTEIGDGLRLETDPDAIDRFWYGGELDFLEVYT